MVAMVDAAGVVPDGQGPEEDRQGEEDDLEGPVQLQGAYEHVEGEEPPHEEVGYQSRIRSLSPRCPGGVGQEDQSYEGEPEEPIRGERRRPEAVPLCSTL